MGDARDTDKAPDAFRTISEVADDLELPQHVLRFWESRFTQIRPVKRAGGRRYYRTEDVDLLRGIRDLLYADGYTIKGVQKILREHGVRHVQDLGVEREAASLRARPPRAEPSRGEGGSRLGGLLGLLPGRRARVVEDEEPPVIAELPFDYPELSPPPEPPESEFAPRPAPAAASRSRRVAPAFRDEEEGLAPFPTFTVRRSEPAEPDRAAPERVAPSFAPPAVPPAAREERALVEAPRPQPPRRPSRGPAARVAEHAPEPEFEDPLLPFFDDLPLDTAEAGLSEPLEDRIRRLRERAPPPPLPGPPEEYLPPKARRGHAASVREEPLLDDGALAPPPRPRPAPMPGYDDRTAPPVDARGRDDDAGGGRFREEDAPEPGLLPEPPYEALEPVRRGGPAGALPGRGRPPAGRGAGAADWDEPPVTPRGRAARGPDPVADPGHAFDRGLPPIADRPSSRRRDALEEEVDGAFDGAFDRSPGEAFAPLPPRPPARPRVGPLTAPLEEYVPESLQGGRGVVAPRHAEPVRPEAAPLPVHGTPVVRPGQDGLWEGARPLPPRPAPGARAPVPGGGLEIGNDGHGMASDPDGPGEGPGAAWPDVPQRAARPPLRQGPPEQYLPPHLRSEPRLSSAPTSPAPMLSREDVHRLQATLYELGECRRLLGLALSDGREGEGG